MRLDLGTKDGVQSMRIGFTDQRLTAHGGLAVWTRFITEAGLRDKLAAEGMTFHTFYAQPSCTPGRDKRPRRPPTIAALWRSSPRWGIART